MNPQLVSMNVELGLMQVGGGNVVVTKNLICKAAFNTLTYDVLQTTGLNGAAYEIQEATENAILNHRTLFSFTMNELLRDDQVDGILMTLVNNSKTNVGVLQRNRNGHYHMIYFRIINQVEPVLILTDEYHHSPHNLNEVKILTPFTKLTKENLKNVKFSIDQFKMLANKFKSRNMFDLVNTNRFSNVDGLIVAKSNATRFDSFEFKEEMEARKYRKYKRIAINKVVNPFLSRLGVKTRLSVSPSRTRTRTNTLKKSQ